MVEEVQTLLVRNRLAVAELLVKPLPDVIVKNTSLVEVNLVKVTKMWWTYSKLEGTGQCEQSVVYYRPARNFLVYQ